MTDRPVSPDELIDVPLAELENERRMRTLGLQRARSQVEAAVKCGRRTTTRSGQSLLRESVRLTADGIAEWLRAAKRRRGAGVGHSSIPLLDGFKPAVLAVVTARVVLDAVGSSAPLARVAFAVGAALEDEAAADAVARAKDTLWADLRRTVNRARGKYKKRAIVRNAARNLAAERPRWSKREKLKVGVVLIELFRMHTGLVAVRQEDRENRWPRAVVEATPRCMEWLTSADARSAELAPVYLPTVVPPSDWTTAWDGGYLSNALARRPILKTRDPQHVEEFDRARPTNVYRCVNTLQRTAWEVNPFVHTVARELFDAGASLTGFSERGDEPPPAKPTTPRDRRAEEWRRYLRARADWRRRRAAAKGNRVQASRTLFMADLFKGHPFWFPHQVDFRGRVYPIPFFLQPQGNSLARGLLRFADGKPIRDRLQAQAFMVHGANCAGLEKRSFRERVAWVQANEPRILEVAAAPLERTWWTEQEKPWEFLAWCRDYADWRERPAQHVSHLPVAVDCTNSGLQVLSLLMRDPAGAEATNCVPTESPRDVYSDVADAVTRRLQEDPDPRAAQWLEFLEGRVPRAFTKRPTMTLPYGATTHSCHQYVRDEYEALRILRGGVTPFQDLDAGGYKACAVLANHVWAAIGERLGPAQEAMRWLHAVSDVATAAGVPLRWEAPSGMPVFQKYTRYTIERVCTRIGSAVRFTRFREDTDKIHRRKQANGVSPNFIHSIDAAVLVRAVNRARHNGIKAFGTVHDSFATLAADAPVFSRCLREAVADTFRPDLLARFAAEVQSSLPEGVTLPPLPELGDLNPALVKDALYFSS